MAPAPARAARAVLAGRLGEAEVLAVEARELATRAQDPQAAGLYRAFLGGLRRGAPATFRGLPRCDAAHRWRGTLELPIAGAQLGRIAMTAGDRDTVTLCWQHLRPACDKLPVDGKRTFDRHDRRRDGGLVGRP